MIFNTKEEAFAFNHAEAVKRGCQGTTTQWYHNYPHETETTTLTKEQYAELKGIPAQIVEYDENTEEETTIDNPEYTKLESSITVPKWVVEADEEVEEEDE